MQLFEMSCMAHQYEAKTMSDSIISTGDISNN